MDRYPRVLVISTVSFNLEAGGGVTMTNLFRGWPINDIAQIYSHGVNNKDKSVCRTYYHIPAIHRGLALMEGQPLFRNDALGKSLRRYKAHRLLNLEQQFQECIAFARNFKPDVAYVRPMDKPSSYWWLCHDLCKLLNIPYVTHIMDDWPARYTDDAKSGGADGVPPGIRGRIKSARMNRSLRKLFGGASANIAISPEMAAGFYERYGHRFVPFHNSVDTPRWESLSKPKPSGQAGIERPFVIRYIGAVVPDKELLSLQEIAKAVKSLNAKGRQVRLEIHCGPMWNSTVDEQLADDTNTVRGAFLSQDELPGALSSADLLVLPMNFDARSMRYVGYSLQTKGPEYMASGTPILVYGPPSNPNVRYARDARWAVVVDRHSPDGSEIEAKIEHLIRNPDAAIALGARGKETARANHDSSVVSSRFQQLLAEVAGNRS
ncbi:MAG: glycosyltransferase family 4 protein [Leptolyngbya sp. SIO3F4]|nr:glycosyltransferase family 4 protein [Leptolyngbya sp. SIO3F4]